MDILLSQLGQYWQAVSAYFAFDTSLLERVDMVIRLSVQCVLLFCSAFFSSSETALFSLSRYDLQQLRREKNPLAETIHELLDQPRQLIISILSGNELVNIASAANMASILVTLYGADRAVVLNLLIMVPLLLLMGEVTPKTIAVSNPLRYSTKVVARPMSVWLRIVAPLVWLIRGVADQITTMIVGPNTDAENILQMDELKTIISQVSEEGIIDATERALIYNLLEANETEIVEIMTPRTQVAFLNIDMSNKEIIDAFISYRHSRVPVFKTHRDNILGFIHAEDVLRLMQDDEMGDDFDVSLILHPPVVVPLTKKVDEVFDFFQRSRMRAAICLNEFGGVEGMITMNGVLSFIFGDITGGEATIQSYYEEKDNDLYEVPGDMKLTDFNNLSNFGIEDPRMTTVGGYAFRLLDRLPREGDRVQEEDILMEILEMDNHRVAKVRVAKGYDEDDFDEINEQGLQKLAASNGPKPLIAPNDNSQDLQQQQIEVNAENDPDQSGISPESVKTVANEQEGKS